MKKYLYLLIALTAMAVPALASNLTLTVRNDADQIIPYTATVTADNQSKTTGGDGRVRFTDLPDGVVNVYVSCPGYYSRIVPMTLYGENAEEVKLWKNRGKITIYVRNPGNGVLSNSTVICNGETQTFNASGNFVFSDVPDGLQTVNVSSVGYYPQSVDIEMNGKNKEATVVLRPSRAQVTVSSYYPTGSRIGDAAVTLNGETQPSSASGNYTFYNVPDGVHTVTIEKDGYYARIFDITVAGAAMTVPVTLYPSGARVSVTLYYEGGSKVNAADITFNNETITSSPSGVYTFYNVPDGTHELVVEKAGYYTRRSEVTVSGENKNVDIVLCNSGSDVKVNVYNKSGTKVSSANVTLNGETQTWSASGVFTFSNVPDGTHTLTVEKNHYYTQSPKITVAGKDLETDVYLYDSGSSALTMSLTYESGSGIGSGAYAFIDGDEEHSEVVGTSGVIGFSDVPDGVHTVTVKKDGYYTREIEVVTAGNNKNVPVTLCDTGSKVTVPVSFEDNTNVINAEVTLNGETQTYSASGNYVFYNVPDGVYTLNIAKTHYYTRNIEVTVNGSDVEVPVTIYNSDATVTVPVSYENGNLVINADVTLNGQTQTYSASGNYVFSNVPDGVHNVTVHKDGYYDRNIEITVAGADVTVPVTIFNSVSTVEISPMDPYGIRLSDASVNFNGDTQTWSASGIFTFRNVPDGIYTLNMGHKDYLPVSLELTVLGQDYSIDVPFQTYQKLPEGDVFGYVRDSVGNPIAGATVTCGGLNLTTGVDGSFRFPDVPNGAYTVTASADGFIPASGQAEIDFASFYLTINPDSALGSAFGYITDRAGTPIKNASVACNGATVLTADDGLYRLPAMINGDYEATVTAAGFEGGSLSFVLDGGAKMVSTSLKLATGSLSGYVTDLGFNPIPGATVSVEGHTATAAADGSYTVTGIPNGSHAVTVSADGFISVTSSVTADGGAVRNNFALKAARGDIWGHVKDTGGNALKDVDVTLGETTVKTDAEGIYTIPNVPNGAYTMDVAKDNFIPASAGVTVDGKAVYQDFIIAPDSGDVSGYVTDAGFNPIAGASVTMGEYSATTAVDGSYVIAAPKNGDYTLTATAPGFYT
ncbi:MAG: carboxypeptidase regulatory-like domain-containing protein, partial [Abditibacteriota bacterium]|nr:carboxypeptidase regulatory-like domain-containing protein [Abditibacteriota bacterium]